MKYTNGTIAQYVNIAGKNPAEIQLAIQNMVEAMVAVAKSEFQKHFPCSPYSFKTDSVSTMIDRYSDTLYATLVYTITYN